MRLFRAPVLRFAAPVLAGCISTLLVSQATAANFTLTGNDPIGTNSFANAGVWDSLLAPTAGNDYFTSFFQLRTPATGDPATFAGDSLSLDLGGSLLFKGTGNFTINKLILNGGSLIQGQTGGNPENATLSGNITVAADSVIDTTPNSGRSFTINSLISGAAGLTIQGTGGTVTLTSTANSFTGPLTLAGTTAVVVSTVANGGVASGLGAGSSDASSLVFNGGTLRVTSLAAVNTDRLFTLAGNATIQANGTVAAATTTFSNTGSIVATGAGNRTLTLGGTNTGTNVFAPKITDSVDGGITSLVKADAGTWSLTNSNTYTGATSVNGGVLIFSNLSSLGAGTAINLGGGTLRWGSGNTADITTRTVTLTAGTSILDTNGQSITLANAIGGTGALRKLGGGILTLNGENTFTGNVTIGNSNGGIRITNSSALGVGAKTITITGNEGVANAPHLLLDASSGNIVLPSSLSFTTSNDGRNGAGTTSAITNVAGNNTINGNFTLTTGGGATAFLVNGGSLTLNGTLTPNTSGRFAVFTGAGNGLANGVLQNQNTTNILSVDKEGAGTWVLNGANTYTGSTNVKQGTLITNTASTGGGAVTVSDGATFGVRIADAGQKFQTSALTVGTATGSGGNLAFDLGAIGNPTIGVINTGSLSLNGSVKVAVSGTNLSIGTIKLVSYGTLSGAGFGALSLGSLPTRTTATLVNNTSGSSVDLNITAFDYPRWTGASSNVWDVDDGTGSGTANWKEVNSGNVTRYLQGAGGNDSALFDDTAAADKTTVNLTSTLTPASVLVNNTSARTYTFQGSGKLSGATSITKQGSGMLIIANTGGNDYSGVTTITGGTLQVGDGVTAGAGQLGSGAILNNANLLFNRPDDMTFVNAISGVGTVKNGGSGTLTLLSNITDGNSIVQSGPGVLLLNGNNTFTGTVTATAGTIRIGHVNALGSPVGGTTIQSGATLDLNGFLLPAGEVVTISGSGVGGAGALVNTGPGGQTVGLKNLALGADATISSSNARWDVRDTVGGVKGNGFKLTKVGPGDVTFRGVGETGLGDIEINEGILRFETDATLGDATKTATINAGGTLGFYASTATHQKKIALNGGRILAENSTTNISGAIALSGNNNQIDSSTTLNLSGVISGSAGFAKVGTGTVELNGTDANVYTGLTTVSAGTLRLNKTAGTAAVGGDVEVNSGTLAFGAANQFSANSSVTINNGGTWSSTGNTVQTLKNLTINTGTLQTLNAVNVTGTFSLTAGQHDISSGQSFTANTLSITGGANLRLGANTGNSTANIGAGGLFLDGTLQLGQAGGTVTAQVNLGGDVTSSGYSFISAPNNLGPRLLDLQGGNRTFQVSEFGMLTVAPSIQNGGLTKSGLGTLALTGASTYQGDTVIKEGTLSVSGSISGSANIDVKAGATLDVFGSFLGFTLAQNQTLKGKGTITGSVIVDGTLAPGEGDIGSLTFESDLSLAGNSLFELFKDGLTLSADLASSSTLITLGGTLTVTTSGASLSNGDSFRLFQAPSYAGSFTSFELPSLAPGLVWDTTKLSENGTLAVVPEPASAGLLLTGIASLLGMRRPRRR
ncbi:autotransporter-associated beta strand repeat-containing protein [Verrucomicrobiota bacterium sgz303538]